MRPISATAIRVIGGACLLIGTVACTADTASPDEEASGPAVVVPEQSAPAERLTPFCQEMNDISARIEDDPPADIGAYVLERYRLIVDEVPDAIAVDFAAVIADLAGEPIPTLDPTAPTVSPTTSPTTSPPEAANASDTLPADETTGSSIAVVEGDDFFEEGYEPGDTPAARVNSYVAFACRDTANNPGPPATQPLSAPVTTAP